MRRKKGSALFLTVAIVCVISCLTPYSAEAKELPPHLIQTVSEQDIYEGMLALGYLETAALDTADCETAYENIKDCIVRIQMGNAHGSGIIWEIDSERIVIVTNRHVLDYWTTEEGYVHFPQGYDVDAWVLGVSKRYDVGFVAVGCGQFTYEELQKIRYARADMEAYEALAPGDEMFLVDAGSLQSEARYYEGNVEDKNRYIEEFDANMLYGHCFAKAGMSGGGTFDGRGFLIGMTTGGTNKNETASVPLPDLVAAYGEVVRDAAGRD